MSLDSALAIANTGLNAVSQGLAIISQNIANASTPGYSAENEVLTEQTAGGLGDGVVVGAASRQVDTAVQNSLTAQNATVAGWQTTSAALSAIDQTQGTVAAGNDLASLIGNVQNAFTTLASDPSNQTQQQAVVSSASTLASGINALSNAYQVQRQQAQTAIAGAIAPINAAISAIGSLTTQIAALQAQGKSTADLENQRDAAVQTLSSYFTVSLKPQPDGSALLVGGNGLVIPTNGSATFATANATIGATSTYPANIPAITLNGVDVTDQLTGGSIGANVTLRDQTLPAYQAGLDEVAAQLSNRFAAQGLTLFTYPNGSLPASTGPDTQSGYVGYAAQITVNPTVVANPADVRDGTQNVAGSATGASAFTVNPAGGPASFSTLITRVLNYALGRDVQQGVPQPSVPTTGLGENGALTAPFASSGSVQDLAASLVASQAADSGNAQTQLANATGLQTSLTSTLSNEDGVNVNAQLSLMVQLQNSYGANARVLAAVEAMWTTLFTAVTPAA